MKISKAIILPIIEKIENFEQVQETFEQLIEVIREHNLFNFDDTMELHGAEPRFFTSEDWRRLVESWGHNWSTLPDDGHKPNDDADVTGEHTAFDIINLPTVPDGNPGLFVDDSHLGYHDGSNWKAYIQNDGKFYFKGDDDNLIQWDGANLGVKGSITITGGSGIANLSDAGALATQDLVENTDLGTTIIQGGYLRTDLIKVRKIYVGAGTNEDIYFEDSAIRMYDGLDGNIKKMKMKYSTTDFFEMWTNAVVGYTNMKIEAVSGRYLQFGVYGTYSYINSAFEKLKLYCDDELSIQVHEALDDSIFYFYAKGQFRLPALSNAPPGGSGRIVYKEDVSQTFPEYWSVYYSGWRKLIGTAGW